MKSAKVCPVDWLPKCRDVKGINEEYTSRSCHRVYVKDYITGSVTNTFVIRIGDNDDSRWYYNLDVKSGLSSLKNLPLFKIPIEIKRNTAMYCKLPIII